MVYPRTLSGLSVLGAVPDKPESDHRIGDLTAIVAYRQKEVSRDCVGSEKANSQSEQAQQWKDD
jgi:hypothetical protein